jgi:hypothetical protein
MTRYESVSHSRQHIGNGVCGHLLTFLGGIFAALRNRWLIHPQIAAGSLPTRFGHARNFTCQRELAEADAAQGELA